MIRSITRSPDASSTVTLDSRRSSNGRPPTARSALELRNVVKEYPGHPPVRALDDVSVRVDHGELVAVEANLAVVPGDALLVDLNLALRGTTDGQRFSADLDSASHLGSVDDDEAAVGRNRALSAGLADLGQHRLARARRLLLEGHAFNIPCGRARR